MGKYFYTFRRILFINNCKPDVFARTRKEKLYFNSTADLMKTRKS